MKITKRQLRRIIRESGRDWDLEDNVSYFIAAGPPEKAIKYLEKLVAHAESGGEVGWKDAMNSHDPEIANFEYAKKRLEALKSGADGAIGHSRLPENAISKRQLRQIIREEKRRLVEYSDYPSWLDLADQLDDISEMLDMAADKYVTSEWLNSGENQGNAIAKSVAEKLEKLYMDAETLGSLIRGSKVNPQWDADEEEEAQYRLSTRGQ